jgi:CRISPR-associated protein Csc2
MILKMKKSKRRKKMESKAQEGNNNVWESLETYFLATPEPIIGAKTIQILIIREILDYAAFRTEDTKELNTMVTPTSVTIKEQISRVAFLASKQKAVETREMERMLRTAVDSLDLNEGDKNKDPFKNITECYLKDNLCRKCPRCILHGATALSSEANIKHRIEYSTATSLLPWNDIEETITFNAINDKDISTGQALGTRYLVKPATIFPSIITLKSVTKEEFILAVKSLLSCKSYGAETRIGGDVRNHIIGIVAGWEEIITSLEFTLELYDEKTDSKITKEKVTSILESYKEMAGNKNKITIEDKIDEIIKAVQETNLDKEFLSKVYTDSQNFYNSQNKKKK